MLKCFITILFSLSTAYAFTCGSSNIEVLIQQKVRVNQKIEIKKDWMDLDTTLSIHSGNITSLRLQPNLNASTFVLNWMGVQKEIVKLKNGETLDYNLGKSFDQYYKKATFLTFTAYSEDREICQQKIKLYGGD